MKKTSRFLLGFSSLFLTTASLAFNFPCFHLQQVQSVIDSIFCHPDRCLRDGFYVGVGAGYDSYKVSQEAFLRETDGTVHSISPPLSVRGWLGNFFGGYGLYFGWFYFGGEIFANTTKASVSSNLSSATGVFDTDIFVRSSLGFSLLPGIKVNDSTLIYGRLGYVRTSFKVHENGVSVLGVFNNTRTQWGNGWDLGIGMETAVFTNTSIRMEYKYTRDSSFDTDLGTRYIPSDSQFVVGAIYHFAC